MVIILKKHIRRIILGILLCIFISYHFLYEWVVHFNYFIILGIKVNPGFIIDLIVFIGIILFLIEMVIIE